MNFKSYTDEDNMVRDRLFNILKQEEMHIAQMARDMGIGPAILSRFLKKENGLSFATFNKVEKYLNRKENDGRHQEAKA